MKKNNSLVGIIDEDPYDAKTWSGSSAYFFRALKKLGVLHTAISAQPTKLIRVLYKTLSFYPQCDKWRFRYHLNPKYYLQMTRAAKQALDMIDPSEYQAIVQIGAWYDLTGYRGKPVVSYHDGNLATLLSSPYGYPRISASYISRTLDYERDLYKRINLIFPMSKWLADSFMKDFGVSIKKIFPVGAGINLPLVLDVRNKSYNAPNILFVGKDFTRKGGEDLLEAFKLVRRDINNAELTIIGTHLESPPMGVRSLGFISKQSEKGVEKLLAEYQRATVFVLPSLYEPFGISFAEAMAHRLPCIGTNICAMPEIIQHGKTGYLVPPSNPVALANSILSLLHEPDLCRDFGNAGFSHYQINYTWQAVSSRMSEIIDCEL